MQILSLTFLSLFESNSFKKMIVSQMNRLSVFLSHQVKCVTKLHPAHKETCHIKLKVFLGHNGLPTLGNIVSPLFFKTLFLLPSPVRLTVLKNLFACLFSVHNTISLSSHEVIKLLYPFTVFALKFLQQF